MSRKNVERLTGFYEAFNAGDTLASFVSLADPEFVYRTRAEFPDGGAFDLKSALDRIAALRDLFEEIRWEPREFIDAGERTVVVVRQTGRGRGSGAEVDQSVVHVWLTGNDGRVKELRVYSQRSEALRAAGLED